MPYWVRAIRQSTRDVTGIVSLSPILTVATRRARPEIPVVYCPAALNACEQPAERLTLYQRLERQAFRRADAVLFPAEEVRDAVREHYGRSSGRSAVCPLGVDGERLEPAADPRRSFGIPADAFMLLTVGTINANKGQRQIARALAAAARCDWWWVVIGDGPERQVVIDSLRGSTMRERAVFVEEAARLGDWYAAANVLVSASRCETFGLVCAEALRTGLPVLVPENRPGAVLSPLAHTVMAAGLGRTYDRNSPAELLDALTALADDRAGRSDMGARAHGFARRHFSWQRYVECLESLLQPSGEPHWNRDARITISAASGVRS
jgi:glycosyltransferase involved in cell wall biosynthesis